MLLRSGKVDFHGFIANENALTENIARERRLELYAATPENFEGNVNGT